MHIDITTDPMDGAIRVGSYEIPAPMFTDAETFARALHRAITDGIRVTPADRPGVWITSNPTSGTTYITTTRTCTCPAGLAGVACKHLAALHLALALGAAAPHGAAVEPEQAVVRR